MFIWIFVLLYSCILSFSLQTKSARALTHMHTHRLLEICRGRAAFSTFTTVAESDDENKIETRELWTHHFYFVCDLRKGSNVSSKRRAQTLPFRMVQIEKYKLNTLMMHDDQSNLSSKPSFPRCARLHPLLFNETFNSANADIAHAVTA